MKKFIAILLGLLVMLSYVNSLPAELESAKTPSENFKKEMEEYIKQIKEKPATEEDDSTVSVEDANPSDKFENEVEEYLKDQEEPPSIEDTEEVGQVMEEADLAGIAGNYIYQGNTVALQTKTRNIWLGVSGSYFRRTTCPGIFMDYKDWRLCSTNTFKIYRYGGAGALRVGDVLGIYHPSTRNWIGCNGTYCTRNACPGTPTIAYGFSSQDKWFQCFGSVFRIYVNGKRNGQSIASNDDILIYYLQGNSYLYTYGSFVRKGSMCPGYSRPPSQTRYDQCSTAVFKIFKQ